MIEPFSCPTCGTILAARDGDEFIIESDWRTAGEWEQIGSTWLPNPGDGTPPQMERNWQRYGTRQEGSWTHRRHVDKAERLARIEGMPEWRRAASGTVLICRCGSSVTLGDGVG